MDIVALFDEIVKNPYKNNMLNKIQIDQVASIQEVIGVESSQLRCSTHNVTDYSKYYSDVSHVFRTSS
ncbi:hypothetical protein [Piscirickettsia litoralis]|uniref:Uncharacterized protein n=1 Tax=Piscirickettsia litoralis TaxID=1891921 RepID=A0ABX3A3U9_9GAMM|nr:hypothetical protein [Piscirickettsia litoralis]ODN43200.1 hypothetical protein BGC07_10065 [Piscirickettsia litoralis]